MTRLYRKGDIVSVRCTILVGQTTDEDGGRQEPHVRVIMPNQYDRAYVPASAIELIIPHFDLGDLVSNGQSTGKVMAKDGNALWVCLDGTRSFETWSAVDTDLFEIGGAQ